MRLRQNSLIFFLIILTGTFLRFYNINHENFWIDETLTFWIANPRFSLIESFNNHRSIEQVPYLFNLIIKVYFQLFGYETGNSRYLPAIFSSLSIISISYISKQISKNNAYILTAILISLNIFLISYAQEIRLYSLLVFFISLTIILYFNYENNKKLINFYILNLFLLITIFLHPFALILYFSLIICDFKFDKKIKKENINKFIIYFITGLISLIYYLTQYNEQYLTPGWIKPLEMKFFTNYFFSNFFGSRLIGLIFLLTLILFIIKNYKEIISDKKLLLIFIFLILSYFLPILYGFLFKPILNPRYIIFVIIPILVLISHFTFKINKFKKNLLSIFLILTTAGNLTTEETFKQFFKERAYFKHDFKNVIHKISNSDEKNYTIILNLEQSNLKNSWDSSITNYIDQLSLKLNKILNKRPLANDIEKTWVICVHDLNQNQCDNYFNQSKMRIKLNRIDLIFIN